MNFAYSTETLRTPALALDYYLVPWDSEIVGFPVAQIADLKILDTDAAHQDLDIFSKWCASRSIGLCACRLDVAQVTESMFLQEHGFRFIELNYSPVLKDLQSLNFEQPADIDIGVADESDRDLLVEMAGAVFSHGRFHQDPRLGRDLGNRRYRIWMANAFTRPEQTVLKCSVDGRIVAFFVVEQRGSDHRFWSLIGLAPGLQGGGLSKRVWRAMLAMHRAEGVKVVSTSISSHNVPVMNLYVSLGFRFPSPNVTLHWQPEAGRAAHH